ncbi:MAG: LysM peptidoglycan-binding domain-containing protein [Gemmatimonadota bacterium]
MKRIATLLVAMAVAAGPLAAQQPADSGRVHVVDEGDTLWDLARQYLSDPFLWPRIFSANQQTVFDPDLIFPRSRLLIPGIGPAPAGEPIGGTLSQAPTAAPSRTVFFVGEPDRTAQGSTVRLTAREEVPVVPSGIFFGAGLLAADAELAPVGQLVEVISPTVVDRSAPPQIQPYDRVNVALSGAGVAIGERVHLVRPGRELLPYGRIYIPTGSALVLSVEAGTATLEVDRFYERIDVGDLVFPMPNYEVASGVTPVPAMGLEGELLAFRSPQPVASTEDVAFVNLGGASGVVVGDEFEAYLPAVQQEWGRRPEVVVARLQVIRVARLTSAVRVTALEQPALEEGIPVRLVARMP